MKADLKARWVEALSASERELLAEMRSAHVRGAFATACDRFKPRQVARSLERRGFAEWKGDLWGSSFWAITDAGLAVADEIERLVPVEG